MSGEKSESQHNVFISWSGERSRHVAEGLRDWLPMVLQAAKPFMSATDIEKGSRGSLELAKALETIKVGIVCLTPENLSAKWILFEAGALSKTQDRGTRVCTYLLGGLRAENVERPLGEFQATRAEQEETRRMLQDINKTLGSPVAEQVLDGSFRAMWPELDVKLKAMPEVGETGKPPRRSMEEMLQEVLELSRGTQNQLSQLTSVPVMTAETAFQISDGNARRLAVESALNEKLHDKTRVLLEGVLRETYEQRNKVMKELEELRLERAALEGKREPRG